MIDAHIVEVPNPGHPYGVRGVGEVPIVPPTAAVANAIYDAIGLRLTELPMSPPRVLEAWWDKNGGNGSACDGLRYRSLTMPEVWIPSLMRKLTDGQDKVVVGGNTLREVIEIWMHNFPVLKTGWCTKIIGLHLDWRLRLMALSPKRVCGHKYPPIARFIS